MGDAEEKPDERTLAPVSGEGILARYGDRVLLYAAHEGDDDGTTAVLDAVASAADGDGRRLIRRLVGLLARASVNEEELPALAAFGPVGEGVAVIVYGAAQVAVSTDDGEIVLDGRDAVAWVDRVIPAPARVIRGAIGTLEGDSVDQWVRLDAGVVRAGGFVFGPPSTVTAAPAAPQPSHTPTMTPAAAPVATPVPTPVPPVLKGGPLLAHTPAPPVSEPLPPAPPVSDPLPPAPPVPDPVPPSVPAATSLVDAPPPPPPPVMTDRPTDSTAPFTPSFDDDEDDEPPAPPRRGDPEPTMLAPRRQSTDLPAPPEPSRGSAQVHRGRPEPEAPAPPAPPAPVVPLAPLDPFAETALSAPYAEPPAAPPVQPPPPAPVSSPSLPEAPVSAPSAPPLPPPPAVNSPTRPAQVLDEPGGGQRVSTPVDRSAPFEAVLLIGGEAPGVDVQDSGPLPPADTIPPAGPVPADGAEEADARPIVLGIYCKNDHFNDPRVPYCAVCGISMAQLTHISRTGPRPPLGLLVLDDGATFRLDTSYVVGREPERDEAVVQGRARSLRIEDSKGVVSRIHARIELDGWDVTVIDLGSANGTHIAPPNSESWTRIEPHRPIVLTPGTRVVFGRRGLRYESHRNP